MGNRIDFTVSEYFLDPVDPEAGSEFVTVSWVLGDTHVTIRALGAEWSQDVNISLDYNNNQIISYLNGVLMGLMNKTNFVRANSPVRDSLMENNETYENGLLPFYEKYGVDRCYDEFWNAVIQEQFDKWINNMQQSAKGM